MVIDLMKFNCADIKLKSNKHCVARNSQYQGKQGLVNALKIYSNI